MNNKGLQKPLNMKKNNTLKYAISTKERKKERKKKNESKKVNGT